MEELKPDIFQSECSENMSDRLFQRFSDFIYSELGIKMPDVKKCMLQARLQKRMRKLGIISFKEYHDYVFSPEGREEELQNMIDVITTNKTDFFREPKHFEYLTQTVMPKLIHKLGFDRIYMFWSAGCSTGEEPYTLAMVLSDFAERHPGFVFSIIATDISTKVLEKGMLGIYEHEKIEPISMPMRRKYLLKSKDKTKNVVRISPCIRSSVKFRRLNLMEKNFFLPEKMDVIFFRNVLIYFDRATQEKVLTTISRQMHRWGYLFIGHSETLNGLNIPLIPVTMTVYQRSESGYSR